MIGQYLGFGWLVLIAFIYMNVLFVLTSSMDLQDSDPKRETPEEIEPRWMDAAEGTAIGKIKYLRPHTHEPVAQAH